MTTTHIVTLIEGDGVGSEVVDATRKIIDATGVKIEWQICDAGANVFKKGISSGVPQETLDSIQSTRVVLKGPLETPVGYGEKSANVTLRKLFETYANIRPVREYPGIKTPYSGRGIDFVIVRENVEDLYAGIEHMQTPGVAQTLKLISRKGCEKIIRFAFELARAEERTSVHCATKANIMKLSEGMLKKTFEDIAGDYPEIRAEHIIVDNCAHQMVMAPENFDVIVSTNMNGDILSDLGSGLVGGLGFAPGANLGLNIAIFEAVHGSAPTIAGKNIVNPLANLLSGVMMLRHIGAFESAQLIEQSVLATLEAGIYTQDVRKDSKTVTTTEFRDAIMHNLGQSSSVPQGRSYKKIRMPQVSQDIDFVKVNTRSTVGIDVFIESGLTPDKLGQALEGLTGDLPVSLKMISSRGVKVYPSVSGLMPDLVDHYRCRFLSDKAKDVSDDNILDLLKRISTKWRWVHLEKLNIYDGVSSYSKAQGED